MVGCHCTRGGFDALLTLHIVAAFDAEFFELGVEGGAFQADSHQDGFAFLVIEAQRGCIQRHNFAQVAELHQEACRHPCLKAAPGSVCSITASSARLRSVKSRVTLAKPVSSPFVSRIAVITMFAQKRAPSLRTRQPSCSIRPRSAEPHQFLRPFALNIFLGKEAGEMFADDFIGRVVLDALSSRVPGCNVAFLIEQINSVVTHAIDERPDPTG